MRKDKGMEIRMHVALLMSISHHEQNLRHALAGEYDKIYIEWDTCPLCTEAKIVADRNRAHCSLCPIFERTRQNGCNGTSWNNVWNALADAISVDTHNLLEALQDEIDFLRALLP